MIELYKNLADQDNQEAMSNLAFLYLNGTDVNSDFKMAIELFTTAI